jgi:hypothetical protein
MLSLLQTHLHKTYHIETGVLYTHLMTGLPEIDVDTMIVCPLGNVIVCNHFSIDNARVIYTKKV